MKPKIAIIYSKKSNDSLVAKNKVRKENPNALIIESSNKDAVSDILKNDDYKVISCDPKMDARVSTSEKARVKAKAKKLEDQHKELAEAEAKEKATKKTTKTSVAQARKPATKKKTAAKPPPTKTGSARKAA